VFDDQSRLVAWDVVRLARHVAFWDGWEAEEAPFLDRDRPWERADVIVAGSPVRDHDPDHEVVVAPALPR
jgi:hypothetical protein